MAVSFKKRIASEKISCEKCVERFPLVLNGTNGLIGKINDKFPINKDNKILELGSAQGLLLFALGKLGYSCEGVEPWPEAVEISRKLENKFNQKIKITESFVEKLPFNDEQFDLIIANSVLEHVRDLNSVLKEIYRVLKPRGAFYFCTASSLCPMQEEIRFFPFFSWYPDKFKVKIMNWAKEKHPGLIGFTNFPAINWFTPWSTRKLSKVIGFSKVYDQWDLVRLENRPFIIRKCLNLIKRSSALKIAADVLIPHCSYLVIKENMRQNNN
jgi:SAM-dependent methyltransferase